MKINCPYCKKELKIPRFWCFTQHELSIFHSLLGRENLEFKMMDSEECMSDQNNPMENTRKALFKELSETPCHCCYKEEDFK